MSDRPRRGQPEDESPPAGDDPFVTGTPLETLSSSAAKIWPPGEDMGDLTPTGEAPEVPYSAAPPVRVSTIERDESEPAGSGSGGADPSRPIGRGNPPRAGQQKPGAPSRNPAGRPRGIQNPDRFSRFLAGKVAFTRADGKKVRISRIERLMELTAQDAANGDPAMRRLQKQIIADEHIRDERRTAKARRDALRAEQATAPVQKRLQRVFDNAIAPKLALLARLQDRGIVTREPLGIAEWIKALIAARTD